MRHRKNYLALYYPEGFCIRLSPDIAVFPKDADGMEVITKSKENLSVFTHEYWYYLMNCTTLSRYRDLSLLINILSLFTHTLDKKGFSSGVSELDDTQMSTLSNLVQTYNCFNGDTEPRATDNYNGIKIKGLKTLNHKISFLQHEIDYETIHLLLSNSDDFRFYFHVGNIAIEESLAYNIEKCIYPDADAPFFPYYNCNLLFDHYLDDYSNLTLLKVLTIALLSSNPAKSLIQILQDLSENDHEDYLKTIVKKTRDNYINKSDLIIADIDNLLTVYKDRGMPYYAIKYLKDLVIKAIALRKVDPLFELKPFEDNAFSKSELMKLFRAIPPCDVIQEFEGNNHELEKDSIFTFNFEKPSWNESKYQVSEFLRSLHCQFEYILNHLDLPKSAFCKSEEIKYDCECPYFTTCNLKSRIDEPEICKNEPWAHFHKQEKKCWYSSGVAGSLGTIEFI